MQKVTNRIIINYNENEQEAAEKAVEFSNRLTELFKRMFTENFKIEINVKQFDEMVELVIKNSYLMMKCKMFLEMKNFQW